MNKNADMQNIEDKSNLTISDDSTFVMTNRSYPELQQQEHNLVQPNRMNSDSDLSCDEVSEGIIAAQSLVEAAIPDLDIGFVGNDENVCGSQSCDEVSEGSSASQSFSEAPIPEPNILFVANDEKAYRRSGSQTFNNNNDNNNNNNNNNRRKKLHDLISQCQPDDTRSPNHNYSPIRNHNSNPDLTKLWIDLQEYLTDFTDFTGLSNPTQLQSEILQLYRPSSTNGTAALHLICKHNPPFFIVRSFHDVCPKAFRQADSLGRLPLHYACHHGCDGDVLEFLVDAFPKGCVRKDALGRT